MLDVIHYFFEDDYRYTTNEESIYKDEFRKSFYQQVYSYEYKYASEERSSNKSYKDFDEEPLEPMEENIQPFNPKAKKATKAYIEPTPLSGKSSNPFGDILDGPVG